RGLGAWLGVLLVWDFFYYWKHRLGHEVNLLWAAHSVHHQSEEYNLTTALRQTSTDFLIGWAIYLPMFLLGVPVAVFATVSAIDLIYQFWVHTRYVDKLGWVDRVFVTPSNHRVHHAQNAAYMDKNYGGILILWDRLFGTFEPEADDNPPVFGVRKSLSSFNPVTANLQVYRYLWADACQTRSWRDKLALWFARPGWRPADLGSGVTMDDAALRDFQKYAGVALGPRRGYFIAQFALGVVLTFVIAALAQLSDWPVVLAAALALWWLLLNVGAATDGAPWGAFSEWLRLALTPLVAAGVASTLGLSVWTWAAPLGLWSGISVLWLATTSAANVRGQSTTL
ncbi:MAG: sterol desaturase family protein, partial [Pseudomonadota bacterium]